MAPILALDTSGSFCSVALRCPQGSIVHRESEGAGDHFERMPQLVQSVLSESGCRASELGQIRVGIGPGSFTGLRIGMSFAKGLSVAAQVPVIGVSSLDGIAWSTLRLGNVGGHGDVLVVSDARRAEVFMSTYLVLDGVIKPRLAPCIAPTSEAARWCAEHPDGVVVTPVLHFSIPDQRPPCVVARVAEGLLHVNAATSSGFSVQTVALLEPEYLRAVSAKSIAERG